VGNKNYNEYGPHMFACLGVMSFGWTGSQCCGDDTKSSIATERFNDTQGGCFDGTAVGNNQSVADRKGYYDSSNPLNDEVKNYPFKYLLYTNDSFAACQMPTNIALKVSYNGTTTNTDLVRIKENRQCTTLGGYYCADGAWRQSINTNEGENQKFPDAQIQLKTVPAGIELLKNTFGGR
jgi:hypothetical protein